MFRKFAIFYACPYEEYTVIQIVSFEISYVIPCLESVSLENPFYYLEFVFLEIVSSENPAYDLEFVYLANPEAATSSKPHSPLRHHLNTALTPMMMMMKTKMLMMKTMMLMMKTKIPSEMVVALR